ncbi:MAG TPA: sigma-54 dependent transcriptional regulator [Chitinophagaceae bacterium]|nr:sigma-54 dependent transcriptional regulator [Chitinophagaceae bacterium]
MQKILVIDDDRDMCLLLKHFLTRKGYEVTEMYNGKKALEYMESAHTGLVMCDLRLEDMDGIELLKKIKEKNPSIPVIIMTGYSDIKTSVNAIKLGAFDYVTKPLLPDEILLTIQHALQREETADAGRQAIPDDSPKPGREKAAVIHSGEYIFGDTDAFINILKQINLVAPTNYSVIIYGESGSGKEAIAQEIHKRSKRAGKPFVAIDCGALSKELSGSELFGHEKGAFTGALNQKAGSFEIANGGTIFLDEIGNLSYDVQVSLLRVVQERKCRRVGGLKDIDLDVRIIIASNEQLWEAARKGKFREDLYHRFNEFNINVPPLRERKEDIMLFAHHFLQQTNAELDKRVKGFTPETEAIFKSYVWYGNLRELRNVIKKATLLTETSYIEPHVLPFEISNYSKLQFAEQPANGNSDSLEERKLHHSKAVVDGTSLKEASIDAEFETIMRALRQANYNKSKAAKILQIDRKTLYNKMNQYQELKNF